MKSAVVQFATPTTNTTVDVTDAAFSSDVKAAILFWTRAIANNTDTSRHYLAMGIAANNGGTTQGSISSAVRDANASGQVACKNNSTNVFAATSNTGTDTVVASLSSWLSNGIRLNFTTTDGAAYLATALLLGGDIEAKVLTLTFSAGTTAQTAHGLGGVPEILIGLDTANTTDGASTSFSSLGIGFWCTGGSIAGSNPMTTAGVPANTSSSVYDTRWPARDRYITVGTVDATNVNLTASASTTSVVRVLALRGLSSPISAAVGLFSTPTATGNNAPISGLSFAPQGILLLTSAVESTNELLTGGAPGGGGVAEGSGIAAAVNNGGTTQQGSVTGHNKDNVDPTVARSQASNTKVINTLSDDGSSNVEATVNSWDSAGVTLNYSNVHTYAQYGAYLAFAQAAGAANPTVGKFGAPFRGKFAA